MVWKTWPEHDHDVWSVLELVDILDGAYLGKKKKKYTFCEIASRIWPAQKLNPHDRARE